MKALEGKTHTVEIYPTNEKKKKKLLNLLKELKVTLSLHFLKFTKSLKL